MSKIQVVTKRGIVECDADTAVNKLEGSEITVAITKTGKRSGFETQMSVQGVLEKHTDRDEYRVMVSDSTYTYFRPEDVLNVVEISTGICVFIKI